MIDEELGAFKIEKVGSYGKRLIEGWPVAIILAGETWIGWVLLFHS